MQNSVESEFHQQVDRLHRLTVLMRWSVIALLWFTVGIVSLWGFRYEVSLLREHFTWAALRYGIMFNRLPALGLALCIGMTLSVLYWQTRNILCGRSPKWQQRLEQQVMRIRQQGQQHPLWYWVCRPW